LDVGLWTSLGNWQLARVCDAFCHFLVTFPITNTQCQFDCCPLTFLSHILTKPSSKRPVMKQCPKCNSSFPDTDEFCERDGTALITNNPNTSRKAFVLAVVVAAMLLGLLLVACQPSSKQTIPNSSPSSNQPIAQQVVSPPPPLASPSPSETPSPSPSPSPTPTPKPKGDAARGALSTSPVSTSGAKRGPVIIRLTNGTSIKADEVWEASEGIWYRRAGLVTLLKRDQVRAIEKPPPPKPSPTASPVPSP